MIGNLSWRERTVIAAGGAVVLVIAAWSLVVQPIVAANRVAAEMAPAREQMLQRRRDLVARKAEIIAELEATRGRVDALSARLLAATTPAVAASELQKIVKDMAAQAKMEVRSERIMPTVERGELVEVPVEIAVSGEIRQLVDLLARLDAAPKLLVVQELRIRVVNMIQPRELLATITLAGFNQPARPRT
jgi:general secretion pathway protein M